MFSLHRGHKTLEGFDQLEKLIYYLTYIALRGVNSVLETEAEG